MDNLLAEGYRGMHPNLRNKEDLSLSLLCADNAPFYKSVNNVEIAGLAHYYTKP